MSNNRDWNGKHIVISRTDSIGDVVLTLPLCAALKEKFPKCTLTFLCKNYTAPIVKNYACIDHILIVDDLLKLTIDEQISQLKNSSYDAIVHVFPNKQLGKLFKRARIALRIGTSHRIHHLFTCNVRPSFTRKGSNLHESQLNFKLMESFGFTEVPSIETILDYNRNFSIKPTELPSLFNGQDLANTICLHPKSQGSAVEWPMEKYVELALKLVEKGKTVCFTGTEKEGQLFRSKIPKHEHVLDSTGQLTIDQLQWLIHESYGLVACSTGPLHIAAIQGKHAIGLYSPRIPIHPGRWKPLGPNAVALVNDENCPTCSKGEPCTCITQISVDKVLEQLNC